MALINQVEKPEPEPETTDTPASNLYVPPNKELRPCWTCKKPGYMYTQSSNGRPRVYFIHYNEPPIGRRTKKKTGESWPKYRMCFRHGKVHDTIEDAIAENERIKNTKRNPTHNQKVTDSKALSSYNRLKSENIELRSIKVRHRKLENEILKIKRSVQKIEGILKGRK